MERTITNLTIFFLSLLPSSSARSLSGCPSLNKQVILLSTSQNSLLHPQDVSSSQQAGAALAHPWCVQLWVLLPVQVRRETTFAPCSTESQVPSRQVCQGALLSSKALPAAAAAFPAGHSDVNDPTVSLCGCRAGRTGAALRCALAPAPPTLQLLLLCQSGRRCSLHRNRITPRFCLLCI